MAVVCTGTISAQFTEINLPDRVPSLTEVFNALVKFKIEDTLRECEESFPLAAVCTQHYYNSWTIEKIQLWCSSAQFPVTRPYGSGIHVEVLQEWTGGQVKANKAYTWTDNIKITDIAPGAQDGQKSYFRFTVFIYGTHVDKAWAIGACLPIHNYEDYEYSNPYVYPFDEAAVQWDILVKPAAIIPDCTITADPLSGEAPLLVLFQSHIVGGATVDTYQWDFGDGGHSTAPNPYHWFQTPGIFTVKLRASNQYGYGECLKTITVIASMVNPAFSARCSFPTQAVNVGEPFNATIIIENNGGPGNIFVYYEAEGVRHDLLVSQPVAGYGEYNCQVSGHDVYWWLGYNPTENKYVNMTFYTGPVGEPATSTIFFMLNILTGTGPECTEGDQKCIGQDLYECIGGTWTLKEVGGCAGNGEEINWLPYVAIGGGVGLIGLALILARRK